MHKLLTAWIRSSSHDNKQAAGWYNHISPTQVELLPGPQGPRLLWVRLPGIQVVLRLASDVGPKFCDS